MRIRIQKKYLFLFALLIILIFKQGSGASCSRQRCCLIDPCTSDHCIQKNSQSWISTQNFANYQYTKLILSNNSCKPCPYFCKTCLSQNSCSQCAKAFYLDNFTSLCFLCTDRCQTCTVVNSITKCSLCQDGTYLDSTTLSCKSCPQGAKTCSSSTAIIQCLSGYKKSSNSLYCTACPSNCLTCPVSDSVCTSCSTGYYLNGSICSKCNVLNCQACLKLGSNIVCTTCNSGYLLQSGNCILCPSNCKTCSSSTICNICNSSYYLIGGACSMTSVSISNCQYYLNTNTCSSCLSNYYLKNNLCYPCSILCSTCDGSHFGECLSCNSNSQLFNKMCLINNFPSTSTYNLYFSFPASFNLLNSGTLSCSNQYAVGSAITLNLNNLKGSKLQISWKLYSIGGSTTYGVKLINSEGTFSQIYTTSASNKFNNLCDNDLNTFYFLDTQKSQNFTTIKKTNTLTFYTDNSLNLALHQILITVYRCNQLCVECSQSLCTQCIMTKLYTQDAYCVYTCSNNYYIYIDSTSKTNPKTCLPECPLGTYTLSSNVSCMACVSPCLTCLNQLFCLSCIDGYYLTKQNFCNQTCPYRYYGKIQTKTCQKCVGRCLQCISQDKCLSCRSGFLYNLTNGCLDSCQSDNTLINGLYADLNTLHCENCNSSCMNCLYQKNNCIQCVTSKFLYQKSCLTSCPDYYFAPINSNICQSCQYPCKNCQTSATLCVSCIEGYLYNQNCINDCPTNFYEDNINLKCLNCDSKCNQCYGSATYCLSCKISYFYLDNKCYSTCPAGYYSQNSSNYCTKCVNLCKTCLNQTYCLTCKSNFFYNGQCISSNQCPSGYFADIITLQCKICSSPCLQCQYDSTYCTKCNVSNVNGLIFLQNHTCVVSCSSLYYYPKKNSTLATCQICEQPCLTCLSSNLCLSCISGYKYSNNICSSICSIGTYFNFLTNDCSNCSINCQICSSAIFCQKCKNNYYVNSISSTQNQCVLTCPTDYYTQGLSASCQKCIYPCNTCLSSIDCISCISGVFYQNRCLSSCPDSTYMNIVTNQCLSCQGNCLTCSSNPFYCQSCKTEYYLYYKDHTCLSICPFTFYAQQLTKSCLQCPLTCAKCVNSTFCTDCIPGKTYKSDQSNICVEYCPSGYFGNDTILTCQKCSNKCLTCNKDANNCLSCSDGYFFIKLNYSTSDCQINCPSEYYSQSNYCYSCVFPCKTCTSSQKCLGCTQGTYYHKASQSCLLNCPSETYYNFTNFYCQQCTYPCKQCDGNTNYCLSCQQSKSKLYLYNGNCVLSCPLHYYADQSGICNKCYGLCSTCSNKYYCLTCLAGYSFDGFCYSQCPLGTFANTTVNICQACHVSCTQCILTANYCVKCSAGLLVYKGSCSSKCPNGTYQDNGQCQSCNYPCISCNNQNSCNECLGGYLLYMNISCIEEVTICPNDFYKMNSKYCVPVTWCHQDYFIDETLKTCTQTCDRKKYTNLATKKCQNSCSMGWYASTNLICAEWVLNPPISLMVMSAITYINSSYLYIQIQFNQTCQWNEVQTNMYVFSLVESRLLFNQYLTPEYSTTILNPTVLKLKPQMYPERISINLDAYRIKSSQTNYPLQNPLITISLPSYTWYSSSEIYEGIIMQQFSEGISWFIMLLSFFFLFKNRLSDLYVLWDNVQLLYLLLFLEIQYPPNLNQFFKGLAYTNFTFLPSIFSQSSKRNISDSPFYAYSFDNSFLRNTGGIFLVLIVVFGIFIILKVIQMLFRKVQTIKQKMNNYPRIKSFIYKGIMRYRWHHISDFMFLTYVYMMLFATAQINFMSENSNVFSNVLAITCMIFYIGWVIFVGYKLLKHFKNISRGKMVNNLKCFYRGIQKQNKFGVCLVLIRYARKLFYCVVISLFSTNPMFALPILMFSSILMTLFLFINLPYKKKLSNIITILSEIILIIVYILLAFINFNKSTFDSSTQHNFGWICCIFLAIMIFALIYQVFCKTMFYLEPQASQPQISKESIQQKFLTNKQRQYLRKKAEQFFDSLLPKLRQRLNFDQNSDDQLYNNYEEGDSQNSENNERREKSWQKESGEQDEFKHYENSSNSEDPTAVNSKLKIQVAPQYLVRCVKDIQ